MHFLSQDCRLWTEQGVFLDHLTELWGDETVETCEEGDWLDHAQDYYVLMPYMIFVQIMAYTNTL